MKNARISPIDLSRFTGTENYYRHGLVRAVTYTDGVKFLVEQAGAYWLLDKVATLQLNPKVRAEEFQVWKLQQIGETTAALLTCDDGNDNIVHTEAIHFTDFPFEGGVNPARLYFCGNVIMLPSEY